MAESKLLPYNLAVKRGALKTLKTRFTAQLGSDMTGWTATIVIKDDQGSVIFTNTQPVITEFGTPHIGSTTFELSPEFTAGLRLGAKQFYHVRMFDTGSWNDIVMYGNVDAYVTSGGS
jgi:hypothetical protein